MGIGDRNSGIGDYIKMEVKNNGNRMYPDRKVRTSDKMRAIGGYGI